MHYFLTLCSLLFALNATAHEEHTLPQKSTLAISVAFDAQGKLWRASVKGGFVQVDNSADLGKTFSKPVQVNKVAQKIGADGEARPKIAISPEGNIYLTWTEMLAKPFTGYVWFARSINHGKSFDKPIIVHQDRAEITHRFDALHLSPDGKITVTWVDKRDLLAAKAAGNKYEGAAIYYAVSNNNGVSFAPERKLADSSCECCRIATTNKPDGTVVAMWRHVFEGSERDHMIAEIPQGNIKPQLHRATFGHWKIDGCPHHGAALAAGGAGKDWWGYHMAYFDGNDVKPGLYYSRMDGVAWASSPAKKFGNNANQAAHPAILSFGNNTDGEHVWLVWREIEAKNTKIIGMFSDDGGRSWNNAKVLASASEKADYPQLMQHGKQIYLAWNTLKEGFKLILLTP
ncbi:exo-alpha-sialidase [Methylotenera versatilis]|uniref:exo-alpha-sialidase n=1 Tax=Methylotenera versatilis TaxID=1055487 RepID=UPI00068EE769|nr:exo-alpha-sialidase [Methylotenera versatilis]